jgi:hypothetical protein
MNELSAAVAVEMSPSQRVRRFAVRWLGVFLALIFVPAPLGHLRWIGQPIDGVFGELKERGALWLAGLWQHSVSTESSGGSDRTIEYYATALFALIALLIAVGLTLSRFSVRRDRQLASWLRGYVRLALASSMFLYGICKLFPLQFHFPGPRALTMKVGDMLPWEVMWLFMGVSKPYSVIAGVAEVLGGALLLWRRTRLLGAVILLAVMGNVVLMDFCYDVDMKLYASQLLLAILFVLAPDAPRLLRALVPERAALGQHPSWQLRAAVLARYAVFVLVAGEILVWAVDATQEGVGSHPLHGIWQVAAAERCEQGWHTIAIQRGAFTTIGRDHARKLYKLDPQKLDADSFTLLDADTDKPVGMLIAKSADPSQLMLAGDLAGEPLQLDLRRSAETALTAHRFAWTHDTWNKPR